MALPQVMGIYQQTCRDRAEQALMQLHVTSTAIGANLTKEGKKPYEDMVATFQSVLQPESTPQESKQVLRNIAKRMNQS
jgi:hypothetical protein